MSPPFPKISFCIMPVQGKEKFSEKQYKSEFWLFKFASKVCGRASIVSCTTTVHGTQNSQN